MRPLVDLIGKGDEEAQRKEEAVEDVPVFNVARWVGQDGVATDHQEGQCGEAVVAICFNVVMTGDGQRVNVMLSERANERLQE